MTGREGGNGVGIGTFVGSIEEKIRDVRGQRVVLDSDLARLYGVEMQVLHQAVRRNAGRFPSDFVVRLTPGEREKVVTACDDLATLRLSPNPPYAFTEYGALMAAVVLNSPQAIEMSIFAARAFVRLRSIYASHTELARRLDEIDVRASRQDADLRPIVHAIRQLALPPIPRRCSVGSASADVR